MLKLACESGYIGTVKLLLQKGALVDISNSFGYTALYHGEYIVPIIL